MSDQDSQNLLNEAEKALKEVDALLESGNELEALAVINRWIRKLDRYIVHAQGHQKLKALILIKKFGQIQSELEKSQQ
ncbi:MAG: hypothetical protein NDP13_02955 [Crenarchaeota archaeon]|nr:hypothetical protein [Thermoproteota archaeon]MCR8453926.1 hypothetical protein [Thermoproteota archaeon]MCR8455248.1 hypothetical protein [Thermoproteota archaeon]MCR8463018.1 hypothetical protein [Thermoproteota archaeon]MCR8470646.1 hypothetical protein [Thermoproteota archaeon]